MAKGRKYLNMYLVRWVYSDTTPPKELEFGDDKKSAQAKFEELMAACKEYRLIDGVVLLARDKWWNDKWVIIDRYGSLG